jgi:DNA-binding GntR family transcriptional regulator
MILRGQLPGGTRLVELDIAAQMGTSQGPVREALQRLEQDGLVERLSRSGTFVTTVSIDEMHEIFEVRSTIEQFAIRRIVSKVSQAQLAELQSAIELMREAGHANDMVSLVDADMEIHMRLCSWATHPTLLRAWMPLYTQVQRFIVQTHPRYFHNLAELADRHAPLLEVLHSNDQDAAAQWIHEHIMYIWDRLEHEGES